MGLVVYMNLCQRVYPHSLMCVFLENDPQCVAIDHTVAFLSPHHFRRYGFVAISTRTDWDELA